MVTLGQNSRRTAYFDEKYIEVVHHELDSGKKVILGKVDNASNQHCRFCMRCKPEATFKSRAHSIPEFLGNKSLVSQDECDDCNARFASEYEDHLAKWFGFTRTLGNMRGKNGVPTFKDGDLRIERNDTNIKMKVDKIPEILLNSESDPFPSSHEFPFLTQPFIPIRAAQALVKCACSIAPVDELKTFENAIAWLMGGATYETECFPVLYSFLPGNNPYGRGYVKLLRRNTNESVPYLWFVLATSNHRFQVVIPFCLQDDWPDCGKLTFNVEHYPIPCNIDVSQEKDQPRFSIFNWSSSESERLERNLKLNMVKGKRRILSRGQEDAPNA